MNTINISVRVNEKAALLKGLILGHTTEIAVSAESMGETAWPLIVAALDMGKTPPVLGLIKGRYPAYVAESTPTALRAAVEAIATEAADAERKATAEVEKRVSDFEADGIHKGCQNDYGYSWERWTQSFINTYGLTGPYIARIERRAAEIAKICSEHNAEHAAAIAEAKAASEARMAAAEAERKAAEKAANAVKFAKRLETGTWERECGSYNERRYGSWWCAKVSFPNGPKPEYEWGDSTCKWGKAGLLTLPCVPGDIIAWGQKDLRRPGNSTHNIQIMRSDGSMITADKTEAYHLSELPLAERLTAITSK